MKVYSPFQSSLWLECPIKRILVARERWVPREIAHVDMAAMLGLAVAAGLEVYNKRLPGAHEAAVVTAEKAQTTALALGRTLAPRHQAQWDRIPERARVAVASYAELADLHDGVPPGLPPGSSITSVEESYGPAGGYARPDVTVDDGRAPRVPLDYKTTLAMNKRPEDLEFTISKKIAGWANSFQMFLYCDQETRRAGRPIQHYYIGHIVIEPFSFELLPFEIHPETMVAWKNSAKVTWEDMTAEDEGLRAPRMAATHANEYGPCPYQKACFTHHWDPALLANDYVRVPRA